MRKLEKSDCAAHVRRTLSSWEDSGSLVNHAVASLEHRTLLYYACWYGRCATARMLLHEYQASPWKVDDHHASPLLVASWAGQTRVVRLLLQTALIVKDDSHGRLQQHMELPGIPPLTSSCGGKGPKSAVVWAERKGFAAVVKLLRKALVELRRATQEGRSNHP